MKVQKQINGFIDAVQTMTPRGSFYNSKDEKIQALRKIHDEILKVDRELYTLFMFYPGINDYNRLNIAGSVLQKKELNEITLPFEVNGSNKLALHRSLSLALRDVSYPRVLKFFLDLKKRKLNNKRIKRTILEFILNDPKLVRRSVTYRVKIREALTHAWGKRTTGSICNHLTTKDPGNPFFLEKEVFRYRDSTRETREAVAFIMNRVKVWTVPEYVAYHNCKSDIQSGLNGNLPYETMMGFRNRHHKGFELKTVTEKTAKTMTAKQKVTVATKAAKTRNAILDVDYSKVDPAQVYREAFRGGELTTKMHLGISKKIQQLGKKINMNLGKISVIVDTSQSMAGIREQENDAISRVLAIADFLSFSSESSHCYYTGGIPVNGLPDCGGETGFGRILINAVKNNPDMIFILTDGYENSPEGLVDQILKGLKNTGARCRIIQINPTYAAEKGEVRALSTEIPVLPISDLGKLEGTLVKALWERNENAGIESFKRQLLAYAAPYLANQLLPPTVRLLKENRQPTLDFGALL